MDKVTQTTKNIVTVPWGHTNGEESNIRIDEKTWMGECKRSSKVSVNITGSRLMERL